MRLSLSGKVLQRSLTFALLLLFGSTSAITATLDKNLHAQALFQIFYDEALARSPMHQTYRGLKTGYDQWDNLSAEYQRETDALLRDQLSRLREVNLAELNEETALSYRLMEAFLQQEINVYRWRHYTYPVNQMFGVHTEIASLLINSHKIDTSADAEAYISRVSKVPLLLEQLVDELEARTELGLIPPKFVFPHVINASENLLKGAPFDKKLDKSNDSTIRADFRRKIALLNISATAKRKLLKHLDQALIKQFQPGYQQLIGYLTRLEKRADDQAGVWKFSDGDKYYEFALELNTTTTMGAQEIHHLGLAEVARIHKQIHILMNKLRFTGSLQEFFIFMREDPRFYFPNTDVGRAAYLNKASAIIDEMKEHLDELFITIPHAELQVQRVETFREKTAGKAFYKRPAINGSRPGVYYANLYNMNNMPVYQMQALAYHEGIPGHHMQIASAQQMSGLPEFRQHLRYIAFVEGWALYAELLPRELGLYKDDYAEFGRLALELWRACRLVVDTGIHAKRWTREQAINYLIANTPNSKQDIAKSVERYIVMPGQATAYTIGMLKFLALRERAESELQDAFDIRKFHHQILQGGAMPLTLVETRMHEWIAEQKHSRKGL